MIKLKLLLVRIINKYVSWSCNFNEKLILLQRDILNDVYKKSIVSEAKENG